MNGPGFAPHVTRTVAEKEAADFLDNMQKVRETKEALDRATEHLETARRAVHSAESCLANARIAHTKARARYEASLPKLDDKEYAEALQRARDERARAR